MQRFQAWSQEERVYDGNRKMDKQIIGITVEDVLWAMYTVNVKLNDKNLDKVIGELRADLYGTVAFALENQIDAMDLERE